MGAGKRKASKPKKLKKPKVELYDCQEEDARPIKRFIKRHPWESVGLAALLGGVLARIFFRRRR